MPGIMLEGNNFLFAAPFRVSHMDRLEFWTVGLIVVALIGLQLENRIFSYIGSLIMQVSKCVPHKITTHPTGKTAPHLRFSNILLAVLEVMSTQNSCLMLSLQQGFSRHFFKVIVYNSRGWSRGTLLGCSNHWTQPFHHPRHPKLVAGSPGCSQCCCLMSCYLGCFVVRREARESSVLGMRCGGGSPKVPGCRPSEFFEQIDGMLRVPWGKYWVHAFFSKSLVRTEQLQHALRFCRILVRQNAQAIQGPDVNVMWSLAADVGVKFQVPLPRRTWGNPLRLENGRKALVFQLADLVHSRKLTAGGPQNVWPWKR